MIKQGNKYFFTLKKKNSSMAVMINYSNTQVSFGDTAGGSGDCGKLETYPR